METKIGIEGVKVIAEALKTNTSVTELDFVDAQKRTKSLYLVIRLFRQKKKK